MTDNDNVLNDGPREFKRILPDTQLDQFHNMTRVWWKFDCRHLQFGSYYHQYIYTDRHVEPGDEKILGIVSARQPNNKELHLNIQVWNDKFLEPFSDWLQDNYGVSLVEPADKPAALPMLMATEDDLQDAISKIKPNTRTPEWWREVSSLFYQYRKVNPKYTQREFAELLVFDEKHVGKMLREHHPKSP